MMSDQLHEMLVQSVDELRAQRDELLKAMKAVVSMWEDIYPDMESGKYPQERLEDAEWTEIKAARAAIAKCEINHE